MGVYKVSKEADHDLAKTYEYGIETFGLKQAQTYLLGLHDMFQTLADTSKMGRDASEYGERLKRFSYKSHIVFYMINDTGVFVVRVLNQQMDFERHL